MSRAKTVALQLLHPGLLWLVGLALLCVPLLFYVFLQGLNQTALAYPVYLASAYTLTVWVVWGMGAAARLRAALFAHPLGQRYLTDWFWRGRLSLFGGAAVNLCYGLFELAVALLHRSFWYGALAVYYLLLAVARGALWRCLCRSGTDRRRQLLAARLCGWLLLALSLALGAVTAQMVLDGKGYAYPGTMIFAMAFYAFYAVIVSIVDLVRFRKLRSPALSAAKVLGVATALVSMLSLQTAMFAAFGGEFAQRRLMNALTGTAVCLALLLMSALMLLRTAAELKKKE